MNNTHCDSQGSVSTYRLYLSGHIGHFSPWFSRSENPSLSIPTVCLECSEADFFLLAVHRQAAYRWKGLVEAGRFWCYWALKVKVISFGMYTFDGIVISNDPPTKISTSVLVPKYTLPRVRTPLP